MRIYDGAMLHATNKQNVAPGEHGQVVSLDLGDVPEKVINDKVAPLIEQLVNGYYDFHEENTENKL